MDSATLRAFDRQLRHDVAPAGTSDVVERDGASVRVISADPDGWSGVVWSNADESTADALIARELARFAGLSRRWEWKYYAHDRPGDLPRRLLSAGFEARPAEAVLIAEVSRVPTGVVLPPGVRLVPVTGSDGVDLVVRVHDEVFGGDHAGLGRALAAGLADAPDTVAAVVALAGDRPVCAGRIEFPPGIGFASLWGGGTVPDWRHRGLFRAVVGYRAGLAAARGARLLQVDATDESAPILRRLGFDQVTSTIPFIWTPARPRPDS